MVDQAYLPRKTFTLTEDNLIAPILSTVAERNASVKENYLSHKTVNLSNLVIPEIKVENANEVKPNTINTPSSTTNIAAKDNYSSHKTVNIPNVVTPEIKVETANEAKSDTLNTTTSTTNIGTKENYLSHKTANISFEATPEIKVEKTNEVKSDTINSSTSTTNIAAKDNYLSHKTANISYEAIPEINVEKTNEVKLDTINTPASITNIDAKDNYLSHKTVNIPNLVIPEIKEEKTNEVKSDTINTSASSTIIGAKDNYLSHKTVNIPNVVTPEIKEEKTNEVKSEPINTPISTTNIDTKGNYLSHKTVIISNEVTLEIREEKANEVKSEIYISAKSAIIKDEASEVPNLYPEQKTAIVSTEDQRDNYPPIRTVSISAEEKITVTIENKKELEVNTTTISRNVSDSISISKISGEDQINYPHHKSHSFAYDDNKALSIDAKREEQKVDTSAHVKKVETVSKENIQSQPITTSAKAKKPVLWIIASIALFIASAGTGWFSYQQQSSLQNEITLLKKNKDDLTDSLKKLKKDKLHFDDLITRGGKLDQKNNITVVDGAAESETIRICFSIADNPFAAKGKHAVYIRLIDPNNNVLVNTKENIFEYRGNQIPFSLKAEIEYKNEEMMLCLDYKVAEKLQKGIFITEIYNEGVLDGLEKFELK